MNKGNGNGAAKIPQIEEQRENLRLRKVLQKAVNKEFAPESLREKIRKMIRG